MIPSTARTSVARSRELTASPAYAPKVNRGIQKNHHNPNPPKPPGLAHQENALLRSLAKLPAWQHEADQPSKSPPSTKHLSDYTPDQIRVLKVRYYHLTHIHQKNDRQVSSELGVRIPDLHLLCDKKDAGVFRPVNGAEDLADFRAAKPLGEDDFQ